MIINTTGPNLQELEHLAREIFQGDAPSDIDALVNAYIENAIVTGTSSEFDLTVSMSLDFRLIDCKLPHIMLLDQETESEVEVELNGLIKAVRHEIISNLKNMETSLEAASR
ncbi:hypothetical protein [Natronoglycomyces albus]|uniref:Uncharacterized protein n=1 Tax=Natronoglycomyces albus TaxID=2811108 RepID=A0A895XU41_9ACTN|nr:hypothetical protein [Natronoglycomyces albus]QSB05168.1 hypothetical protein JQS30_15650 [Natronoglycomyces albus]